MRGQGQAQRGRSGARGVAAAASGRSSSLDASQPACAASWRGRRWRLAGARVAVRVPRERHLVPSARGQQPLHQRRPVQAHRKLGVVVPDAQQGVLGGGVVPQPHCHVVAACRDGVRV